MHRHVAIAIVVALSLIVGGCAGPLLPECLVGHCAPDAPDMSRDAADAGAPGDPLPPAPDLATGAEPTPPPDLAAPRDLARPADLATPVDLAHPVDDTAPDMASADTCAHAICATGKKLVSGCSACATQICARDSYCCTVGWNYICVDEVDSICHQTCP